MSPWIRRGALAVTTIAALAGAAVLAGEQLARRKENRRIELSVAAVAVPGDAPALERGRYLYASRGCADCHGANGAGRVFVDDGKGLKLAGPNISPGAGSVVAAYQPVDWVRTVRHGVKPDGRPLRVMPSDDYNRLTDADLGAVVAYVKSLPPTAGGGAVIELPLAARVLYGFGLIPDAASKIDHNLPPAAPVAEGVTIEHGRYVAAMCQGCHGPTFAGGKIPGGAPDWPAAARLTPGPDSAMNRYADAESMQRMFKSGQRADGSALQVMPFSSLRELSDVDTRALFLFLKALPPAT